MRSRAGDQVVVPHSEKSLPSGDGEWQHPFQLVMIGLVRQVHAAPHEGKARRAVHGRSGAALNEWPRDGVHLMKTRKPQALLRGKSISRKSCGNGRQSKTIFQVKKLVLHLAHRPDQNYCRSGRCQWSWRKGRGQCRRK